MLNCIDQFELMYASVLRQVLVPALYIHLTGKQGCCGNRCGVSQTKPQTTCFAKWLQLVLNPQYVKCLHISFSRSSLQSFCSCCWSLLRHRPVEQHCHRCRHACALSFWKLANSGVFWSFLIPADALGRACKCKHAASLNFITHTLWWS